jgi:hypothetical protein
MWSALTSDGIGIVPNLFLYHCWINALAPAICGQAMLVPVIEVWSLVVPALADMMFDPGALTSGFILLSAHGPRELDEAIASMSAGELLGLSVFATAIMFFAQCGLVIEPGLGPAFPAENVTLTDWLPGKVDEASAT